jgi:hypothetical protein
VPVTLLVRQVLPCVEPFAARFFSGGGNNRRRGASERPTHAEVEQSAGRRLVEIRFNCGRVHLWVPCGGQDDRVLGVPDVMITGTTAAMLLIGRVISAAAAAGSSRQQQTTARPCGLHASK